MSNPRTSGRPFSRSDVVATATLGAIVAVWTIVDLVVSLTSILSNRDVPIRVWVDDASAALPLPTGSAEITLTSGVAEVSDMPPFILGVVASSAVVRAAAILAVTALVLILCRNLARGKVFSSGNTALVTGIAVAIAVGWFLTSLFAQMASNSAVNVLTDKAYSSAQAPVEWTPYLAAFAVTVVAVAFRAGERLQRDTEGLV
ncbi:hypothetical protein [Herbiconiux sp. L3-i23]|uniref:hypothetical protein n=1 Tax=Herbiconiux sp. L3-i23 TaxID=2905871 RepID=UPI002060AA35|nr:hypothetical protein [Herbiconiux sp. L3-i23]BDI23955.1 hypothetical protein L3i23_27310 [Herbiconiux sp. L3-i23]